MDTGGIDWEGLADAWLEYRSAPVWECPVEDCDGLPHVGYDYKHARASQRMPAGDFLLWYIRAGRGWGKTKVGAEWIVDCAMRFPADEDGIPTEWGVFAETAADVRNVNFRGPSGIKNVLDRREVKYTYNKVEQTFTLERGQIIFGQGADDEDVGRGRNLAGAWLDEVVKWEPKSKTKAKWFEGILPALRARVPGWKPRAIVTTTPKPLDLLREWQEDTSGAIHVTRGSTFENAKNLSEAAVEELKKQYKPGSRLYRQEMLGELVDDVEGALFNGENIDLYRVDEAPPLPRVVVAIDQPVTFTDESDEAGIVATGLGEDGHVYVLADRSGHYSSPEKASRAALELYIELEADCLVYETNQGGDWVRDTLKHTAAAMVQERLLDHIPRIEPVTATRGKFLRAQPVSAIYDNGFVHHVGGNFVALEDQMCTWMPNSSMRSPDRLDALVWAITFIVKPQVRRRFRSSR